MAGSGTLFDSEQFSVCQPLTGQHFKLRTKLPYSLRTDQLYARRIGHL